MRRAAWLFVPVFLMAGCSAGPSLHLPDLPEPSAAAPEARPGRLEDRRLETPLAADALLARILAADVVFLGERHDNPWHRQFQSAVVEALVRAGRRPSLVIEMLDETEAPVVAAWRASPGLTPDDLEARLGWEKTGRGPFEPLAPVFRLARDYGLEIRPGSPSRDRLRRLVREGMESLPPQMVSACGLDRPMPRHLEADLRRDLERAHCGWMPAVMMPGMVNAQRLRDGFLAREAMAAAGQDRDHRPVLVLSGVAHARTDRGAPWVLASRAPSLNVLSVGLVEVSAVSAATEAGSSGPAPWDVLWFAPAPERADPCQAFPARPGSPTPGGARER